MRPLTGILTYLFSACLLLSLPPAHAATAYHQAPDFTLTRLNANESLTLSNLTGQWVYLDFWASWCAPCRKSFPWMNHLASQVGTDTLQIIAIGVDNNQKDALQFLNKHQANFITLWDASGVTPSAYGVKAMPSSYLIDPKGNVRLVHLGFRASEKDALEKKILSIIAGKEES